MLSDVLEMCVGIAEERFRIAERDGAGGMHAPRRHPHAGHVAHAA